MFSVHGEGSLLEKNDLRSISSMKGLMDMLDHPNIVSLSLVYKTGYW